MAKKTPGQATRIMKTARAKAATFGDIASNVAERVTQVAATAAGAVVGTVQAVMPDNTAQTKTSDESNS